MNNRWNDPAIPKTGWLCEGVADLGDERELCAMCSMQECRFLHEMSHPAMSGSLQVGCICAGKMGGDPEAARQREAAVKRKAKLKTDFQPEWHQAAGGNPWFKAGKWRVVVFQNKKHAGTYGYLVAHGEDDPHFSRKRYNDMSEAKQAAVAAFVERA